MRAFFTLLMLATTLAVQAQTKYIISGKVLQEDSQVPIAGASVFVSNSSKGTISQPDGSFELVDVPFGRQQLIISSIGYTTVVIPYSHDELPIRLEVKMKRKPVELPSVTVEPDEVNGWEKWGKFFMENFIGTSANAAECKLKNPQAVRFKYSRKNNSLVVIADEPLIIENKALGYRLEYQLEEFNYSFKTRYLVYLGYPFFKDMYDSGHVARKMERNREKAYYGSMLHFMKSLYDNRLAYEGYEVRRLIKIENLEKKRIRAKIQANIDAQRASTGRRVTMNFDDSAQYINRILSQPDEFDMVMPPLLTADSVISIIPGSDEKRLFFNDHLLVVYKHEKEEEQYVIPGIGRPTKPANHQQSSIFLLNSSPVSIDEMGHHSPILDLISFGYWAWSEKVANLLPIDYKVRQPAYRVN